MTVSLSSIGQVMDNHSGGGPDANRLPPGAGLTVARILLPNKATRKGIGGPAADVGNRLEGFILPQDPQPRD
ncbi:hypothetical protein MHEI_16640 [Mycobacterium heidelbergense]|nr:hypothetical protein MHEI_16640 [Mycobacterium heidelbergense]